MLSSRGGRPRKSILDRWAERLLFFWTARQGLKLVGLGGLTIYALVLLAEGRLPGVEALGQLVRYL